MPRYQDQTQSSQRKKKAPVRRRPHDPFRDDDSDNSGEDYEGGSEGSSEAEAGKAPGVLGSELQPYSVQTKTSLNECRTVIGQRSPSQSLLPRQIPAAPDAFSLAPLVSVAEDETSSIPEVGAQQPQWELMTAAIFNARSKYAQIPRSHNMSQESLASLFTERRVAVTTAHLTSDMRLFISIPLHDYQECEAFITSSPSVLNHNTDHLHDAVRMSIEHEMPKQARRIVDRLAIIYLSKDYNPQADYVHRLRGSVQQSVLHKEYCKHLFEALTKQTAIPWDQSSKDTILSLSCNSTYHDSSPRPLAEIPLDERLEDTIASLSSNTSDHSSIPRYQASRKAIMARQSLRTHSGPHPVKAKAKAKAIVEDDYSTRPDAAYFFRCGRVFKVLWHQPGGESSESTHPSKTKPGAFGEPVYSSIRWMLVLFPRNGYSLCCPISTYGGGGLIKKGLSRAQIQAHSIIYSSGSKPKCSQGEPRLSKDPVRVSMADGMADLNSASRIHFGKLYTVEWNVKVMNIGMVTERDHSRIVAYFLSEMR